MALACSGARAGSACDGSAPQMRRVAAGRTCTCTRTRTRTRTRTCTGTHKSTHKSTHTRILDGITVGQAKASTAVHGPHLSSPHPLPLPAPEWPDVSEGRRRARRLTNSEDGAILRFAMCSCIPRFRVNFLVLSFRVERRRRYRLLLAKAQTLDPGPGGGGGRREQRATGAPPTR